MTPVTYDMLESAVQIQLKRIEGLDTESKEGKDALTKAIHLVELLITADKDNDDFHDKEERRKIEMDRNKAMESIERGKQELTGGRVAFEIAKLVVPLVVSYLGYNVFQKRILLFEKTGRVVSTAGRELHLPKFMK